ncbi:alpha/beta hydrolase family protein [Rhodobacter sp. NSM]|uniref:alpha/beta hydrolase family protein n=1 Tax=Rhodobacter sp. NSM TaxID=3457501 RepID=UPI003FD5AA89
MDFIEDGPAGAAITLLLAHGAGAGMESAGLNALAKALAGGGIRVLRFEFGYMAARRDGQRRPPPRAEALLDEYRAAASAAAVEGPLVIGGKSMGGRVASMVVDELRDAGGVCGLICFGYPFHPPGKPAQLRTAHLAGLRTPALFFQGTRDPLGNRDEVETYALSASIDLVWLENGDHDLKPRKSVTGLTLADHLATCAARAAEWSARFAGGTSVA